MALYLSYEISLQSQKIIAAEWSNTDIPVLGVSTSKKKITFFPNHVKIRDNQLFVSIPNNIVEVMFLTIERGDLGGIMQDE